MQEWKYHDEKMHELKQVYDKVSKQKQNNLQALFDTFNFKYENLYDIADTQTKKRINTYIEQWKDEGLLIDYFGVLAKNIYNRTRVKNSEILELLIYSAYMTEQKQLDEKEQAIFKEDMSYYYQEGQKEVIKAQKKKKEYSVIPDAIFLALMNSASYNNLTWNQYIQVTIRYNTQQLYKQVIYDLQQEKQPKIDSDDYARIIKQQNNQKLNINGDKISGAVDLNLIGLNNQAKVEGITKIDSDAKVRFIAVEDKVTTPMCQSLDGQIFNVKGENEFYREYGETQKELRRVKVKCRGLVQGLNLPPIMHHFHYCRSTIEYLNNNKDDDNIDVPTYLREKIEKHYATIEQDLATIIKDYIEIPENVRKRLFEKEGIKAVLGRNTDFSYWDKDNKEIVLAKDIEQGEFAHEVGHALFDTLNAKDYQSYKDIVQYIFDNGKLATDIRDGIEYYYINTKLDLVSEYQTYIGKTMQPNICIENINNRYLRELSSEAYRGMILNINQDKRVLNFVEEMNKNA